MNRDQNKIEKRREYVQNEVNEYNGRTKDIVRELSERLFISEATIWKDLKAANSKDEKSGPQNSGATGKFTSI